MKRVVAVLFLVLALVGGLAGGALWSLRAGNPLERRLAERLSLLTRGSLSFDGALPRLDLGVDVAALRWERLSALLTAECLTVHPTWSALPSGRPLPATLALAGGRLTVPGAEMTDLTVEGLLDEGSAGPRFRGRARGMLHLEGLEGTVAFEADDLDLDGGIALKLVFRALEPSAVGHPTASGAPRPRGRLEARLRIPRFELTATEAALTLGGAGILATRGGVLLDVACTGGTATLQRGSLILSDGAATITASAPTTTTTPIQTFITAQGTVTNLLGDEPVWRLEGRSTPLALDAVAALLPSSVTHFLHDRHLRGQVSLLGVVDGTGRPRTTLRVDLAGAGLETPLAGQSHLVEIRRGAATLTAGPRLTLTGVDATVAGIPVRGAATLTRNGTGETGGEGRLETDRLPVASLVPLFPPRVATAVARLRPSGTVSAQVRIAALAGETPSLEGSLDVDDLGFTLPLAHGGLPASLPRLHADLGLDEIRFAPTRVTVGGTTADLSGRLRLVDGALVGEDLLVTVAGCTFRPQLRLEPAGLSVEAILPPTPLPLEGLAPFLSPGLSRVAADGLLRGTLTLAASIRGTPAGLDTEVTLTSDGLLLAVEPGGPDLKLPHLKISLVDGVPSMDPTTMVLGSAGQVTLSLTTLEDGSCVLNARGDSVGVTALTSFVPVERRRILTRLSPRGSLGVEAHLPLCRTSSPPTVSLALNDVSLALPVPGPDRRLGLGGCVDWSGTSLDVRDVRVSAGSVELTVDDGPVARRTDRGWETAARLSGRNIDVGSLFGLLPTGSRMASMLTTGSVDVVADLRGLDGAVGLHALLVPRNVSTRLAPGATPGAITTGALAIDLSVEGDEVRAAARLSPPLRVTAGGVEALLEGGVDDLTRSASVGLTLTATNVPAAALMTQPGAAWLLPNTPPESSLTINARASGPADAPHLRADLSLTGRVVTLEGTVTDPLGAGRMGLRISTPPFALPGGGRANVSGSLTGSLRSPLLAGAAAVPAITLSMDVPGSTPVTVPVTGVELLWRLDPREGRVDVTEARGSMAHGTFVAEGSMSVTTAPSRLHVQLKGADLRTLLLAARIPPLVVAKADLEFSGSLVADKAASLSGSGFVDLRDAALDGEALDAAAGATRSTTAPPRGPGPLGGATATVTAGSGVLRLEPLSSRGGPSSLTGSLRLDMATMVVDGRLTVTHAAAASKPTTFTLLADEGGFSVTIRRPPESVLAPSEAPAPLTTAAGEPSSLTTGP